jgi:TorA maturation chaperone TorD
VPEAGAARRSDRAELIRALAVLAEPPLPPAEAVARALGLGALPAAAAYSDLFLFQLYPYASVHLGAEGMLGGEARDRVAGFWRAVGHTPPAEPDHLSALLGLYASLIEGIEGIDGVEGVEGATGAHGAHGAMLEQAGRALLHEHLAPWVFAFLARARELDAGFYADWARLLEDTLREDVARAAAVGPAPLSAHLVQAPPLPDPRVDDARDFVPALLAPVRSGAVVTRADLARIARESGLGLRAGERRYALEHLLAQAAPATLEALADEVGRQARAHGARTDWLGDTARFLERRALDASRLLGELAREGAALEAGVGR